jgi:hypothetical protein
MGPFEVPFRSVAARLVAVAYSVVKERDGSAG